ncbi:MAG: S46 family peptidase [Ignavibacteria bacterium]|nr:S46 family peptidase [Ignavibacteria bacterium]
MKHIRHHVLIALTAVALSGILIGCAGTGAGLSRYEQDKKATLDTVKAGRFDGGKMWTFDDPPVEYFQQAYGFRPDQKWLDDVRMAALRYSGCSASFVSADGLVMTNHHCVRGNLPAVQKDGEKLLENGFYAATLEDERKIPNASLDQLVEIRDVTKDVLAAMDAAATDKDKVDARQKKIADIEKTVGDQTKLRAQVVTLYNGGKFALYLYKRYGDVRLVFAPELQAAHFGGEYDNFTYPRYAFDCAFLRIYDENGKPLKTEHFYPWSANGAEENELVFVIGNPGRTSRLSTTEQLEYNRDIAYPFTYKMLRERVDLLTEYMNRNPQKKEILYPQILGVANGMKSFQGRLSGLRDDLLVQRRRAFDRSFRAEVEKRADLKARYGHVWDEIADGRAKMRELAKDNFGLRVGGTGVAEHFSRAFALVQLAREAGKPEAERLEQFKADRMQRMRGMLTRYSVIDAGLDELTLAKQLETMTAWLGTGDPIVQYALQGSAPAQAAKRLISQSVLNDSVKFNELAKDDAAGSAASQDPFIVMARMALPRAEKLGQATREISQRDQVNATLLGRALYDVYGTSIPPDATFTLRIADGLVKGYEYNGTKAPPFTTLYGLFDRNKSYPNDEQWMLTPRWKQAEKAMDLGTRYNFSSTNDIIGGNSGSPMINKQKQVVGLIFDGNMESLPGDFIFAEDAGNRTVSVHSSGILAGLEHVYKALRVASELRAGKITQ